MADVVSALAHLLSDQVLRERFIAEPRHVAMKLGLQGRDLEVVCKLDALDLERQATTLLKKRWHEVSKLIPRTIAGLEDGYSVFKYYAREHWPEGHRKHVEDAAGFLRFLRHNKIPFDRQDARSILHSAKSRR